MSDMSDVKTEPATITVSGQEVNSQPFLDNYILIMLRYHHLLANETRNYEFHM